MEAVKEALLVGLVPLEEPEVISGKLARAQENLVRARRERKALFGIEQEAEPIFEKRLKALECEYTVLRTELKAAKTVKSAPGYRRMSLEPLRWRDEQGLPRLAFFRISNPEFGISTKFRREKDFPVHVVLPLSIAFAAVGVVLGMLVGIILNAIVYGGFEAGPRPSPVVAIACGLAGVSLVVYWAVKESRDWRRSADQKLPPAIDACFNDVQERLRVLCEKENLWSASIKTRFVGVLPLETREKTCKAQKHFREIFIAAEPSRWQVNKVQPISAGDPLVLGWDGGNLWLVDAFDTTPIEEYAQREFVS